MSRPLHVIAWKQNGAWAVHRTDANGVPRCGVVAPPDAKRVAAYIDAAPRYQRYVLCPYLACYGPRVEQREQGRGWY